jgi:hypothetical protein
MRVRTNGDFIAQEFAKIMGNKNTINKKADLSQNSSDHKSVENMAEDNAMECAVDDNEVDDILSSGDQVSDSVDEQIDSALDESSVEYVNSAKDKMPEKKSSGLNRYISKKGMDVMSGLGEIAASLRSKGEDFAADIVEVTAMSISKDLKKEASEKKIVVDGLRKVAKQLDSSGDIFAGDLVRTTIKNIIKK